MPLLDVYERTFDEDIPISRYTRAKDGDNEEQIPTHDDHSAGVSDEEGQSPS